MKMERKQKVTDSGSKRNSTKTEVAILSTKIDHLTQWVQNIADTIAQNHTEIEKLKVEQAKQSERLSQWAIFNTVLATIAGILGGLGVRR